MKHLLDELLTKLMPRKGISKTTSRLVWYWKESGVKETLTAIIRLRQHIDSLLQRDQEDRSQATERVTNEIYRYAKDTREEQMRHEREKDMKKIIEWLSPLESHKKQEAIYSGSYQSEQWLLDTPEFQAWISGRPWTLWCYGDAGTGKVGDPSISSQYMSLY